MPPISIRPEQASAMAPTGGPACAPCQSGPRAAPNPGPVLPNDPPDGWLGILLKDDQGNPVGEQSVTVELNNGQVLRGTTDSQGRVRFEGVPRGAGIARFDEIPDHDTL